MSRQTKIYGPMDQSQECGSLSGLCTQIFQWMCVRITVGLFLTNLSCIFCSFSSLGLLQTFETSKCLHVNLIKMSSILVWFPKVLLLIVHLFWFKTWSYILFNKEFMLWQIKGFILLFLKQLLMNWTWILVLLAYLLLIVAEMSSHTEIPALVQWRFGRFLGDNKTGNYESC
jgi:hypothetical protein